MFGVMVHYAHTPHEYIHIPIISDQNRNKNKNNIFFRYQIFFISLTLAYEL